MKVKVAFFEFRAETSASERQCEVTDFEVFSQNFGHCGAVKVPKTRLMQSAADLQYSAVNGSQQKLNQAQAENVTVGCWRNFKAVSPARLFYQASSYQSTM